MLIGGVSPKFSPHSGTTAIAANLVRLVRGSILVSKFHQTSLQLGDLQLLKNVGSGSGGVVHKVLHVPTNTILALKVVKLDVDENARKQILLELKTLHKINSTYIVGFYDAFFAEGSIQMVLEVFCNKEFVILTTIESLWMLALFETY